MDAKQLGTFIAERRKELGFTQAHLAEQLHVTDKAVSRWERGIGLPDISNMEALAGALDISLLELMQAQKKKNNNESISTKQAEEVLLDAIQLSKESNKVIKNSGYIILTVFLIIIVMLLVLLISDGRIVLFSVGSIILGLIAWGIPIWQMTIARMTKADFSLLLSMGAALLSLMIQFLDIANEIHTGDMAAVEDTIDALVIVVVLFIGVTFMLNFIMVRFLKNKRG